MGIRDRRKGTLVYQGNPSAATKKGGKMTEKEDQQRRNAYLNALRKGRLKSARADLVCKYNLRSLVKELKVPVREAEGYDLDKDDEVEPPRPPRPRKPVPEGMEGASPRDIKLWKALTRYHTDEGFRQANKAYSYSRFLKKKKGSVCSDICYRYGLEEMAQQMGFTCRRSEEQPTLEQSIQSLKG